MAGGHTGAARFLRSTVISGNVYRQEAAGSAAVNTTINSYALAGLFATIQFVPATTQTASATVPAAPSTAADKGWRDLNAEDATNQITWDAANWTVRLRMLASASQSTLVTVIVYRVSGATSTEMGRGTATLALTTTVQTADVTAAVSAGLVFAAGDKVQVEVYTTTLTLGVATPPATATTITCRVGESDANSGSKTVPSTYTVQFLRSATGALSLASTATKLITAARSFATALSLASTVRRDVAKAAMVAALSLAASVVKAIALVPKTTALSLASTVVKAIALKPKTTALTLASTASRLVIASRSFTTALTLGTAFARAVIVARSFTTALTLSASGLIQFSLVVLNRIVGGGGSVIRRVINVFDD